MNEPPLGPSDIPQLYECLKIALSQDQDRQKQAEATLDGLENRHGFTSCLAVSFSSIVSALLASNAMTGLLTKSGGMSMQEIIGNKSLDHSARWLAIIQFKNNLSRHWRLRTGQG